MIRHFLVFSLLVFVSVHCFADGYSGKKADRWIKKFEKEGKARIVFKLEQDDKECIVIRLTPGQYRFAKARARVKRRRHAMIRVGLRPRQIALLKQELGEDYRWSKVVLRISAKRLRRGRGMKNRYVIRPLSAFDGIKDGKSVNFKATFLESAEELDLGVGDDGDDDDAADDDDGDDDDAADDDDDDD